MFKFYEYVAATLVLSCGAGMLLGSKAHAQEPPQGHLYGVGIGVNQEIYRGYKRRTIPLPLIGYRGEKLSVYGPFVSYQLLQHDNLTLNAKLAPRFAGFDDSDSDVFIGMAKRKSSLDGGVGIYPSNFKIRVSEPLGAFNARHTGDAMSTTLLARVTPQWKRPEAPAGLG